MWVRSDRVCVSETWFDPACCANKPLGEQRLVMWANSVYVSET